MYESVNSVWHLTCFFKIVVVVHLIVCLDFWRESLCGCPFQQFNFKWTRLVFASLSSDAVFVSHRLHVGELELSISRCYWFLVLIVLPSTRYFFPGDFGFYRLSLNSDLWEWAIASHGRLLVPPGWLQVTCVGHCSICQSKIFLAHRQCSIRSENLINCGTDLSKNLAVSG